jgi:hypothetical protein
MRPNAPALLADGIHPSFPPYRAYFAAVSESAQRKRSSSSSSRSRGRVARRACTGEYVCDRSRPCKQKNNADAGQRSGDVDERKITDRVFVSEGPAARAGYRADTVARGAVTLASVSAVAVDVRGSLEGSRCQVCGQDWYGYCYPCRTCVYRDDASDVYGVSWRVGVDFGECVTDGGVFDFGDETCVQFFVVMSPTIGAVRLFVLWVCGG